ncbi:hypothetical protein ACFX2F_019453 [Malus domestica]
MRLGFLGPPVLMGRKGFLIDLPSDSFWTCKIKKFEIPPSVPKLCSRQEFPSGMSPGRRAHNSPGGWRRFEGCCRASASLSGIIGQVSSGKSRRARLFGQG